MKQPVTDYPLRVLLVEDEISLRDPLAKHLRREHGYEVDPAADLQEARSLLAQVERPYDVALIDDLLAPAPKEEPEYVGIALLREIKECCPETEVIIFTGWGMERALEALRAGAYRYLAKPLNLDELGMTVRMAAERRQLKQQLETTKQEKEWLQTFLEIGRATISVLKLDDVLERVHEQVGRLMDASGLDVVLYDESGQTLRFELGYDRGEREAKWERPFTEGKGLTDWVIEQRQPLLIKEYSSEMPPVPAHERGEVSQSWLGVPLIARDMVIGAITVQSYEPYQFDETHRQILTTVASQVAGVIENARLYEETKGHVDKLATLYETGKDLTSTLELDALLQLIADRAARLTGADKGLILLVDTEAEKLTKAVGFGFTPDQIDGFTYQEVQDGISGWVLREGTPTISEDILTDPRNTGLALEMAMKECEQGKFIAVAPLSIKGKVIGTLTVINNVGKPVFCQDDLDLVAMLASQVASAIENAWLFSELAETKDRLEALIASSFDTVIAIDQDKKITDFNQQAEEMFDWTAPEMIGQTVARLHMDVEKAREIFDAVNRDGAVYGRDVKLKHRDGTTIPVLLSAALVRDSRGHPIGQAGFMRDLRQVNLLEERLRALMGATRAVTSTLELEKVLNLVVESAVAAFPTAHHGSIHLYDERANLLRLRVNSFGYSPDAIDALSFKVGEGISGWVYEHGQPLVLSLIHI